MKFLKALFFLSFLFFPLYRGYIDYDIGPVTLNPYMTGVLIVFVFVFIVRLFKISGYELVIIFLMMYYFFTISINGDLWAGGRIYFRTFFIPLACLFCIINIVNSHKYYKMIVFASIISSVVFSLIYIVSFQETGHRLRSLGYGTVGLSLIFTWGMMNALASDLRETFKIVFVPILLVATILTFSRVTIVCLVVFPLIIYIINKKKIFHLILGVFLLSLLVTIVVCLADNNETVVDVDKSKEETFERVQNIDYWKRSLLSRSAHYRTSLKQLGLNFIFGKGFEKDEQVIHNFHLGVVYRYGILGYLFLSVFILKHFYKVQKQYTEDSKFIKYNTYTFFVVLSNSIFNPFSMSISSSLIFVLIGMNEALLKIDSSKNENNA